MGTCLGGHRRRCSVRLCIFQLYCGCFRGLRRLLVLNERMCSILAGLRDLRLLWLVCSPRLLLRPGGLGVVACGSLNVASATGPASGGNVPRNTRQVSLFGVPA